MHRPRKFALDCETIRRKMAAQGLQQADLAKRMEATPMQVSLWVNNRRQPQLDAVAEMADVLKCKIDDIVVRSVAA